MCHHQDYKVDWPTKIKFADSAGLKVRAVSIRDALVQGNCTSKDGTFVHSSMTEVVRSLTATQVSARPSVYAEQANAEIGLRDLVESIDARIQGRPRCEIGADEWLKISTALCAEQESARESHKSTLACGAEIERDFYRLKAQEWACEPDEAERRIKNVLAGMYLLIRNRC